ncbi:hypothetical protein GE061_010543 [Apolygus lucorum]|uniref:Uncharacterized protein n=1 Tax=Apolygus lucorum TaxID=248454 RepID=A0A6A4K690_APOLU|nr:hypothetical protein GE061_010543 [Apolygus lucorum]
MWYQDPDLNQGKDEEEEEWGEEEMMEEEEEPESQPSSEEEWTEEMYKKNAPMWRAPSRLPQEIQSEDEFPAEPEILSSTSDDDASHKPRKPKKKFFEDPKFYFQKNKPVLPPDEWDEEENLDNIETLMKQSTEKDELDAVMMGVLTHITPNFGFDDVTYKEFNPKAPSSADSNYDLILSSSDEELVTPLEIDHYKELVLADDRLIDCHSGRKICDKVYPSKYYGLAKILERKEKIKSQKSPAAKSTLSSYMTVLNSSEGSSFCPSVTMRKKGWKLKEPFPKRDSIEKDVSSSSNVELGSEMDRKQDESRPGPTKIYPKCKWYDECLFKLLFKLAVKREKKISTIKTDLDFEIDEILDELFAMSRDARNTLIPKVADDFMNYKNEFMKHFEQDKKEKKQTDKEEIKLWPNASTSVLIDVGGQLDEPSLSSPTTKEVRHVSPSLYKRIPRRLTPRARVEARLAEERALDVKKKKGIIQKKFKPIEINAEALPQAMEDYYKEKEEHKRKKDKDSKPKDDDTMMFKKKHEVKQEVKPAGSGMSLFPSYTKLIPPYANVCKERIRKTLKKYRKAFNEELQSLADQETFALGGVALKRMYVITIGKGKSPVSLNYNEQARLYNLLENK